MYRKNVTVDACADGTREAEPMSPAWQRLGHDARTDLVLAETDHDFGACFRLCSDHFCIEPSGDRELALSLADWHETRASQLRARNGAELALFRSAHAAFVAQTRATAALIVSRFEGDLRRLHAAGKKFAEREPVLGSRSSAAGGVYSIELPELALPDNGAAVANIAIERDRIYLSVYDVTTAPAGKRVLALTLTGKRS